MRYLLDTDTVIYIQRRHPVGASTRFAHLSPDDAGISVVVFGELTYGAEKSHQRERNLSVLTELSETLPILSLPKEAAEICGKLRALLERDGKMIGNNDLWIAAHAIAANLIPTTRENSGACPV